jgi:alanine racemase
VKRSAKKLIVPTGRPTVCLIDLDAVRWNFRQIKAKVGPKIKILSMVKANAYGHGAAAVARALAAEGSDAFGVATVEEGIELRQAGIREPVIVFAGAYDGQFEQFVENGLTPVVYEARTLKILEATARSRGATLKIHIEIDTGMGRIGFPVAEVDLWLPELTQLKALQPEGVLSHFSDAESANEEYTENQLRSFLSVINRLRDAGINPPLVHMAKSAALVTVPEAYFTMVRPGLILYGLYASPEMSKEVALKPVLSWKTGILQLKRLPKGSSLGYGRTFVAQRESLIATLPVGYADGYLRLLSNRGAVLVRGSRAPVVGRISMDLTTIDVTDIRGVQQSDEVVLLGAQGSDQISADELARWSETISYEILTSISARVPRVHL